MVVLELGAGQAATATGSSRGAGAWGPRAVDLAMTTAAQANTYQVFRYPVIVTDAAGLGALQTRLSEGVEQ